MFSSSPIRGSYGPTIMAPLQPSSPVNIENTVPYDVDVSFASSMSISVAGSPPALSPLDTCSPMDVSPIPTPLLQVPRRPFPSVIQPKLDRTDYFNARSGASSKSLVFDSIKKRVFGRELSNVSRTAEVVSTSDEGLMGPPPVPTSASKNPRSRSALPPHWLSKPGDANAAKRKGGLFQNVPVWDSPVDASPARTDRMDIDMSSPRPGTPAGRVSSDENMSPLPTVITAAAHGCDLSSLYEPELPSSPVSSSPPPSLTSAPKSRRRMPSPPPSTGLEPPSSSPPSSPTVQLKARKMEKFASTGGGGLLFRAPRGSTVPSRRSHPYSRRPSINPAAPERESLKLLPPPPQSAFEILRLEPGEQTAGPPAISLMRRALSSAPQEEPSSDDIDSAAYGSPLALNVQRAYARRNQARLTTRADGSPSFRPIRHQTDPDKVTVPPSSAQDSVAPFGPHGLPGFGHNEAEGKILPCHKVQDDGLMRITCETLEAVLRGDYDDHLDACHIIDCRFDYEYKGGHIEGAVNFHDAEDIEKYLLHSGCGIAPPPPSRSGQLDERGSQKKTLIIFHCEFSVKRAPTMAKILRSKDRSLNAHVYPNVHFPEVYVLSGGYYDFFKSCPSLCEPKGYTAMLDPKHAGSCSPSLGDFRAGSRWQRARSYTYGDSMQRPKNVLPFAAAAVAVKKRRAGLTPLQEDGDTSSGAEDAFGSLGESPCPPSALSRRAAVLADPTRPKSLGRGVFDRAVSFRQ